jgi:hypothetical protein
MGDPGTGKPKRRSRGRPNRQKEVEKIAKIVGQDELLEVI